MNLKELLEINQIVFGVDNPKISLLPFEGITSISSINNKENFFLFTGIPNCGVDIVINDGDDDYYGVYLFDYYFNLGDLVRLSQDDSYVLISIDKPFSNYRNPMASFTYGNDLNTNAFAIRDVKEEVTGYVSGSLNMRRRFEDAEVEYSFVRTYLIQYDQTKIMKI